MRFISVLFLLAFLVESTQIVPKSDAAANMIADGEQRDAASVVGSMVRREAPGDDGDDNPDDKEPDFIPAPGDDATDNGDANTDGNETSTTTASPAISANVSTEDNVTTEEWIPEESKTGRGSDDDDPVVDIKEDREEETGRPDVGMPDDGAGDCEELFEITGDFCEQTCLPPNSALVGPSGLQEGSCPRQGFDTKKMVLKQGLFVRKESGMADAGQYGKLDNARCNPHYVIKNRLCQSFCVGNDLEMIHWMDARPGIEKGTCAEIGYPKFVGPGLVTTYEKFE